MIVTFWIYYRFEWSELVVIIMKTLCALYERHAFWCAHEVRQSYLWKIIMILEHLRSGIHVDQYLHTLAAEERSKILERIKSNTFMNFFGFKKTILWDKICCQVALYRKIFLICLLFTWFLSSSIETIKLKLYWILVQCISVNVLMLFFVQILSSLKGP